MAPSDRAPAIDAGRETSRRVGLLLGFLVLGFLLPANGVSLAATAVGTVRVTVDRATYRAGDTVTARILNEAGVEVHALSGQTYCTILRAERRVADGWRVEGPCVAGAPPNWVRIPAGSLLVVDLAPSTAFDKPLPAGTYRIALSFNVGSISGPHETVHSAEFALAAS